MVVWRRGVLKEHVNCFIRTENLRRGIFFLGFITRPWCTFVPGAGISTPSDPAGPLNLGPVYIGGTVIPFSTVGPHGFSGTLTSTVYANDPSNSNVVPLAPNGKGLTFTYQLNSNASSVTSMEEIALEDFSTPFSTDVSYFKSVASDQPPSETDRSVAAGAVLTWDYTGMPAGLGQLSPGTHSALMIVRTNAPAYDLTQSAGIIDGQTLEVPSIGPSTVIVQPEPSSLFVLAVGGMLTVRRRRAH